MNDTNTEYEKVDPGVWKPETDGDSIEGVYIGKDTEVGQYDSTAYHMENLKGQWTIWGSTVLDDKMRYIKEGTQIKIVYKGKQKNSKGQETKMYEVYKAKESGTTDASTEAKPLVESVAAPAA